MSKKTTVIFGQPTNLCIRLDVVSSFTIALYFKFKTNSDIGGFAKSRIYCGPIIIIQAAGLHRTSSLDPFPNSCLACKKAQKKSSVARISALTALFVSGDAICRPKRLISGIAQDSLQDNVGTLASRGGWVNEVLCEERPFCHMF